ncbi:hypothetical protein GQR58_003980 [Nymphon striatum]|nr:hypothetical protein GQR58_003980 [Nymphon striatum]
MLLIWDNPEIINVIDPIIILLIVWWWVTELQKVTQEVDSLENVVAKLCFLNLHFREKHFQQINMFLIKLKKSPPQISAFQYFVIDKTFFITNINLSLVNFNKTMVNFKEFQKYPFCYSAMVMSGLVPIEVTDNGNTKIKWKNLVPTVFVSLMFSVWALIKVTIPFVCYTCIISKWQIMQELVWLNTNINNILIMLFIIKVQVPYMRHVKRSGNCVELQMMSNNRPKRWSIVLRHFILLLIFGISGIMYTNEDHKEAIKRDFMKSYLHQLFQDSVFYSISKTITSFVGTYGHLLPHLTLIWMTLLIDINIMQLQELKAKFEEIKNVGRISVEIQRGFVLIAEIKENFAKYFNFTVLFWCFSTFSHILGHMTFIWDNPKIAEVIDPIIILLIVWWWVTELQKVTQEINMFLIELVKSPPQITAFQYFVIDKKFFITVSLFYTFSCFHICDPPQQNES